MCCQRPSSYTSRSIDRHLLRRLQLFDLADLVVFALLVLVCTAILPDTVEDRATMRGAACRSGARFGCGQPPPNNRCRCTCNPQQVGVYNGDMCNLPPSFQTRVTSVRTTARGADNSNRHTGIGNEFSIPRETEHMNNLKVRIQMFRCSGLSFFSRVRDRNVKTHLGHVRLSWHNSAD